MSNLDTQSNEDITLCPHCNCMTKTIDLKCGKCGESKLSPTQSDKTVAEIVHLVNIGYYLDNGGEEAAIAALTAREERMQLKQLEFAKQAVYLADSFQEALDEIQLRIDSFTHREKYDNTL